MQNRFQQLWLLSGSILLLLLTSCNKTAIYEKYQPVKDYVWQLQDAKSFQLDIKEAGKRYNLYISVRHSDEYLHSNLWVQLQTRKPGNKIESQRFALTLAEQDGRWLGATLGSIYDSRFLVIKDLLIPEKGLYNFVLQHDMRQDVVVGIMDVGIRVEEVGRRN